MHKEIRSEVVIRGLQCWRAFKGAIVMCLKVRKFAMEVPTLQHGSLRLSYIAWILKFFINA